MQAHPQRNWKSHVLGGILLCAAFSSAALTLGRARGAVWLGQPLDVSIQIQYEETESLASLCFEAEVFHADTRQDASRVRVSVAPAAQAQTAQIRVQSSAAVDEPMVTVYLKENCLSKTTRRYVMLADVPSDALTTVAVATLASAPVTPDRPSSAPGGASSVQDKPASAARAPVPKASARTKTPPAPPPVQSEKTASDGSDKTARETPERKKSVPVSAAKAPGGKPQLKLDPLTSLNERVAQLEEALLAANSGGGEGEAQRIQKIESSVQTLLALVAKNERGMAELREQLQKAEAEKYDNVLVYGLLTLLLVAAGLLVYLWRRQQDRSGYADVWRGTAQETPRMAVQSVVVPGRAAASGLASATVAAASVAAGATAGMSANLSAKSQTPARAGSVEAPEPLAADLDLDDLISTQAEPHKSQPAPQAQVIGAGSGSREEEEALPDLPAVDGPSATPPEPAAAIPEFPTVDPVHIDVSHLSLAPVEQAPAPVAAEPMLDFDFSDLGKPEPKPDDAKKPQ